MKILRKFLDRNKVYFNLFSSIALPVAAIYIAYQANRIAESQLRNEYFSNQPDISILIYYDKSPNDSVYTDLVLEIINRGGKLRNLQTETISFIEVATNKGGERDTIALQIPNVYWVNRMGGDNPNAVRRLEGRGSWSSVISLCDRIENYGKRLGYDYVFTSYKCFLRLDYLDYMHNPVTQYYNIRSREGILIDPSQQLLKSFEDSYLDVLPFDSDTGLIRNRVFGHTPAGARF